VQAEKATAEATRPARAAKKGRKNVAQREMLLPIAGKKAAAQAETGKARSRARHRKAG